MSAGRRQTGALVDPRVACRCVPGECTGENTPDDLVGPSTWCRWCGITRDPEAPCPAEEPNAYATDDARPPS